MTTGESRGFVGDDIVERCYQHVARATSCHGPDIRLVVEVALHWAVANRGCNWCRQDGCTPETEADCPCPHHARNGGSDG